MCLFVSAAFSEGAAAAPALSLVLKAKNSKLVHIWRRHHGFHSIRSIWGFYLCSLQEAVAHSYLHWFSQLSVTSWFITMLLYSSQIASLVSMSRMKGSKHYSAMGDSTGSMQSRDAVRQQIQQTCHQFCSRSQIISYTLTNFSLLPRCHHSGSS